MRLKTYCPESGADIGDADRRKRFWPEQPDFVQCPECQRVLVPTTTGKFRQHQPRGRTTASLDKTRDALWAFGKD